MRTISFVSLGLVLLGLGGCAANTVAPAPTNKNSYGQPIEYGTYQIPGYSNLHQTIWVGPDRGECGAVRIGETDEVWIAYAFHDYSQTRYFRTREEAVKWLTDNWCKP